MGRLSAKAQWAVLLGLLFLPGMLRSLARGNPGLEALVVPINFALLGFALLTWVADPLFNLLLRLNRFGRLALSRPQVVASNWLGGWLVLTAGIFIAAFAMREQ